MRGPYACIGKSLPMLLVAGLVPLAPAGGSDAEFSRALNAAGCIPTQVAVTRKAAEMQIYQVSCAGNPPRSVGVYCVKNTCSVSAGRQTETSDDSQK